VVDMPDGETVRVGIERLHLEQDAGKSLHDQHPTMSYVDLNRSGVALMEIVSKPDLRSFRFVPSSQLPPTGPITAPPDAEFRRAMARLGWKDHADAVPAFEGEARLPPQVPES